jgi:hypothetical protein
LPHLRALPYRGGTSAVPLTRRSSHVLSRKSSCPPQPAHAPPLQPLPPPPPNACPLWRRIAHPDNTKQTVRCCRFYFPALHHVTLKRARGTHGVRILCSVMAKPISPCEIEVAGVLLSLHLPHASHLMKGMLTIQDCLYNLAVYIAAGRAGRFHPCTPPTIYSVARVAPGIFSSFIYTLQLCTMV